MAKTSLVKFLGNDYDLICCFGAFSEYCERCAENDISVDILCENCKVCHNILSEFSIFQNVITNSKFISDEEYYFTREIPEPKPGFQTSMVYEKKIRRILSLPFGKYLFWYTNETESVFCSSIRKIYSSKSYNIVSLSNKFYEENRLDVDSSISSISEDKAVFSIGESHIKNTIKFNVNGILQLAILISGANVLIGQDSIVSQLSANIGIPSFIITGKNGKCRIKQDAANIIYSRRANVTPVTYQKLFGIWQTFSIFN